MLSWMFPSYFLSLALADLGLKHVGLGEPLAVVVAVVLAFPLSCVVNWLFESTLGGLLEVAIQRARKPSNVKPLNDPWRDEIEAARAGSLPPEVK